MTVHTPVQAALLRAAWEFGKVGLLIDDSREAGPRVARALYGCEVLPAWWTVVRSLRCGHEGLRTLQEICRENAFGPLRAIAVIDRYLPCDCKQRKAIPWDSWEYPLESDAERKSVRDVQQVVRELLPQSVKPSELDQDPGQSPAYALRFVTSFPALSAAGGADREVEDFTVKWQSRGIEVLQDERREFQDQEKSHWASLLRFGPEPRSRITWDLDSAPGDLWEEDEEKRAEWKASTWHSNVDRIARLLQRDRPVILVTGAGASLQPSGRAPGMPATDRMLDEVCAKLRGDTARTEQKRGALEPPCACAAVATKRERKQTRRSQLPIEWLVDSRSVASLTWKLEEVFSRDLNAMSRYPLHDFLGAFRNILYRYDYNYTYHHWLMARLPWKCLITTNFDLFHERAAQAAATLPSLRDDQRESALRLGTLHPLDSGRRSAKKGRSDGALYKPYGSLSSPDGVIVLGIEDLKAFKKKILAAFESSLPQPGRQGGEGALVVIGHSMRDDSLDEMLAKLERRLAGLDLLWVDPASYRRCREATTGWEETVKKRMPQNTGPVPATALEFIYDLWLRFNHPDLP